MPLQLQNVGYTKAKLDACDTNQFVNVDSGFLHFVSQLRIISFRHIHDLTIDFVHPVSVISGTNTVGKTSILLLLACSFERFLKVDSTSPSGELREHAWKDVLAFTSHENVDSDYSYRLKWRVGQSTRSGEGKRLASSQAWSGLGKKSSDLSRTNAKIRDREVRLIDLERVLPARSFTSALYRKANAGQAVRVSQEVEQAFAFVFGRETVEIAEIGSHINKTCFLIRSGGESYSTYNAASGEESVIYLLKDVIDSPTHTLILIDEVEAGFHPNIQRKLADLIQYVAWRDKKQFVITTHSPTFLSAFSSKSRLFLERANGGFNAIKGISHQAARSKMDSVGYPLVRLYCEDALAKFLVKKIAVKIAEERPHFDRLIDVITSGPAHEVKTDYVRHKRNFSQYRNKVGYCAILDGDQKDNPEYSHYFGNSEERVHFLYPYEAPEKFLVKALATSHGNQELQAALVHQDHHSLFQEMVNMGLGVDHDDARNQCYDAFVESTEYVKHEAELKTFLIETVKYFSEIAE